MEILDDDHSLEPDLAQLLVLEAGRIVEGLSVDLALALPLDADERRSTINTLGDAIARAARLIAAAQTIEKR